MSSANVSEEHSARSALARRVHRQAVRLWSFIGSGFSGAPVTLSLLASMWLARVIGALTTDDWGRFVARHVATGIVPIEHLRLWTPVTAGLLSPGVFGHVVATVLVLTVAAPLENRIGWRRTALAVAVTQVGGSLLGLGVAAIAREVDASWGFRLHLGLAIGPTTWIVGLIMVASAGMNTLWRRRVRVGVTALLVVLALFGGQLQDVIRLAAAVIGLVGGHAILGVDRVRRTHRDASGRLTGGRLTGTTREGRLLVALVVAAATVGPMIAALSPNAVGPFAVLRDLFRASPVGAADVRVMCLEDAGSVDCRRGLLELRLSGVGPTILSLAPSLFLLVLSDGLRRGRRFAWVLTVVGQVVLAGLSVADYVIRFTGTGNGASLIYGPDTATFYRSAVPFLTPVAVLIVLIVTRRNFDVAGPPGTVTVWARRTAFAAAVAAATYLVWGWFARAGFDRPPSLWDLLVDFPSRLVPPVYLQWFDPSFLPVTASATVVYEWVGVGFWAVVGVVTARAFVTASYGTETESAERARRLLCSSSGSALSWMTTWRGNRYWFAPDGRSFVAFRVIAGVAVTTGDPVGPRSGLDDTVRGFAEYSTENGWIPCFYSVTASVKATTDALGWHGIEVAEETVLELGSLEFTGKKFQDVRTAMNRAAKAGVHAEWITVDSAPLAITDQIRAISEEWVADKGMPEMGFTLGGLDELDDPQVRCLIAVDDNRTVHGVTSWMPVHRDGEVVGWTLDFMRRRTEGFRPAMEFLIASAAKSLQEEGAEFVSLSGAPLATIDTGDREATTEQDGITLSVVLGRVLDVLGRTLEPVYGFRSLLAFKSKFQPTYRPLYLTFADPAALPSIGNAIGRAYLPDVSLGQSVKLLRTLLDR